MSTATEFEIKVSNGRIVYPSNLPDGMYKLVKEIKIPATRTTEVEQCKEFVRVPVSELSLEENWFKNFEPKTNTERRFYKQVREVIQRGIKDFYRPTLDPSFDEACTGICYVPGKKPAVGNSYNWWAKTAREFNPECKSRLGTKSEYIAFLAVLIKNLVASVWNVKEAWEAVLDNSRELGHYWNSENAKHTLEDTGSREICGFCDLGNAYKILAADEEADGFWIAGGGCMNLSIRYALAGLYIDDDRDCDNPGGTGWIVCECI